MLKQGHAVQLIPANSKMRMFFESRNIDETHGVEVEQQKFQGRGVPVHAFDDVIDGVLGVGKEYGIIRAKLKDLGTTGPAFPPAA